MTDSSTDNPSKTTIAIAGGSGLIGTALRKRLECAGVVVRGIGRRPSAEIVWEPATKTLDANSIAGSRAVVNLAGAGIAEGRWTRARKRELLDSRVNSTMTLVRAIGQIDQKPDVLINASAIGFYGSRGAATLDETSDAGVGFMPEICEKWENTALAAAEFGVRVVLLRIGVVLTPSGGALKKMLLPFKLGAGGVLGNGRQYMSWIGLTDLVSLILFVLERDDLSGPINATAPEPATNRDFTKTLGRVLKRPTVLPVPGPAIRLLLGEMGQRLLLEGNRVLPHRALDAGFTFEHPTLERCLRHELAAGHKS